MFHQALMQAGITPPHKIVVDGHIHRFQTEGDPGNKNGWYVLFDDPLAGAFGCWKAGISEKWSSKALTDEEWTKVKARIEEAKKRRQEEESARHAECRRKAEWLWQKAKPADQNNAYLSRKGVLSYGVKESRGSLLVPIRGQDGTLRGLQFIRPDGSKKFMSGTQKKGSYFAIPGNMDRLYVAEGYATAATIRQATGCAVAVAFDAGNLIEVGRELRAKLPDVPLVFCADNDKHGVGQQKAEAAAKDCSGIVCLSPEVGTDFNDLAAKYGADYVAKILGAA